MLIIKCPVCVDSIFLLELRSEDHLLQQREGLPHILLETGELKDDIEVILSPN